MQDIHCTTDTSDSLPTATGGLGELAEGLSALASGIAKLPDGSGFMTGSLPLPEDHWIYERTAEGYTPDGPAPLEIGLTEDQTQQLQEHLRESLKHAIRACTSGGRDMDFDPDAMWLELRMSVFGSHDSGHVTTAATLLSDVLSRRSEEAEADALDAADTPVEA